MGLGPAVMSPPWRRAVSRAMDSPRPVPPAALDRAFAADGPYLIDCAIGKDEFVLPMLPPGGSMDDIIVKAGG